MKFLNFFRALYIPNAILRKCFAPSAKWLYFLQVKRSGCLGLLFIGCVVFLITTHAVAQSDDQFVTTVDRLKQSVGGIVCVMPNGQIQINGTGFFLDEHGTFLTAAHVAREFMPAGSLHNICSQANIYFPIEKWTRQTQQAVGFQFLPDRCVFDGIVDVVRCRTIDDPAKHQGLHWRPVGVEWDNADQLDGTAVAFTGFPLNTVIPVTARAHIATYFIPALHFELDNTAWGGASGSPVYLINGKVVGLMIQRGEGASAGLSIAVSSGAINRFLGAHPDQHQ